MKNIFTPEELVMGMFIVRNDVKKPFESLAHARTLTFKVVFNVSESGSHGICNVLTDGCYMKISDNAKDFCDYLNDGEIGYRPLTKDELILLINNTNQGFY